MTLKTGGVKIMDIDLIKYKPYKSVTVSRNLAKIYLHKYIYPDGSTSVVIRKYHLTNEEIKISEYRLIKKYKNLFLYEEFISLKYDTLMTICSTVFDWATYNANEQKP